LRVPVRLCRALRIRPLEKLIGPDAGSDGSCQGHSLPRQSLSQGSPADTSLTIANGPDKPGRESLYPGRNLRCGDPQRHDRPGIRKRRSDRTEGQAMIRPEESRLVALGPELIHALDSLLLRHFRNFVLRQSNPLD
jgi:hypothetical protein